MNTLMSKTQSFADLAREHALPPLLTSAIARLRFETPTPIQSQAIPLALTRKDVVGCAQTGTGKTAAFCIPTLVHLLKYPQKTALILAPTRELILQIEAFWKELTSNQPELRVACLIGGQSMQPQMRALSRRPRLIVATPGRLLDHLGRRSVSLAQTDTLILDEADRMLDMGFAPQLNQILKYVPKDRQTLLFTATWAPETDQLARKFLRDPQKITVGEASRPAPKIEQQVKGVTRDGKNSALLDEINAREGSMLVFARTKARTDRVCKYLQSFGVKANRIHGGRSQAQRNGALSEFKTGAIRVLVATDIAARGIDVSHIAHVVNYDLPNVPEDYVHRIGRTGRADASGSAISLIAPDERGLWLPIARLLQKTGGQVPSLEGFSTSQPAPVGSGPRPNGNKPPRRDFQPRRQNAFQSRSQRSGDRAGGRPGGGRSGERSGERSYGGGARRFS